MKRSEFIFKLQQELVPHRMGIFCISERSVAQGGNGVMMPGCVKCRLNLQTDVQFIEHLLMEVLPEAVEKILNHARP